MYTQLKWSIQHVECTFSIDCPLSLVPILGSETSFKCHWCVAGALFDSCCFVIKKSFCNVKAYLTNTISHASRSFKLYKGPLT